jgi:O-antigen/teichoic acid export membrane protein
MLIAHILLLSGILGQELANVYFSANRKYELSDVVSNALISSIGLGLVSILLFWRVSYTEIFQRFLTANNVPSLCLWVSVLTLPIALLGTFFNRILMGREEIIKVNGVNILQNILRLTLTAFFLMVLAKGLFGAVLAYVITILFFALLVALLVKKLSKIRFSVNAGLLKESFLYGAKGYIGGIAQFLNYRLDMFLVAHFMDVTAVGFYAIAVGMAERLWMIPVSLGTVLLPRVSAIGNAQANLITPKISRHTLFIVFVLSIVLLISARPLIQLFFGPAFLPAAKPLVMLLPGVVSLSFARVLTSDLAGRGRPEFGSFAAFVSLATNIPLNLVLIPKWGICGAAAASSLAYCLATVVVLTAFSRLTKIAWSDVLLMKAGDFMLYFEIYSGGRKTLRP